MARLTATLRALLLCTLMTAVAVTSAQDAGDAVDAGVISPEQAVWVDVRSLAEHLIDNIEGDRQIHYSEIVAGVQEHYPNQQTPIRLYCAVGGRAEKANQALLEAGYTNVINVGGINDARRIRGLNASD